MSVTVVVPWRDQPDRRVAWSWLQQQYRWHHPDWQVVTATAPSGPWVKALAVNPAVAASPPGGLVIVADADVWCPGLADAVAAIEGGEARWGTPHRAVYRLTQVASRDLIAGRATGPLQDLPTDERPYQGVIGGGIVIAPRDLLLEAPLDPRFEGWGGEDVSWGIALSVLGGHPHRGKAPLVHFWHAPQERRTRRYGSVQNTDLSRRYHAAASDPAQMRALIQEATP